MTIRLLFSPFRFKLGRLFLAFLALTLVHFLPPTTNALAHGVEWDYSSRKTVGLVFSYDDGTPMSFAEIKVFGPNDPSALSQTGRADKNGSFAFIPSENGAWLVTSDDGAGHLAQAQLTVAPPEASAKTQETASTPPPTNLDKVVNQATKTWKMFLVISLFVNIALLTTVFKRQKNSPAPTK
ncbi:MAG: DUF4198 domain-containing protein [Deltaproteobacteria bacterium]|jgi:nickel transport protein|nr:DUF4198 domain-containing protein [Deltaproteobacteria bacterium]